MSEMKIQNYQQGPNLDRLERMKDTKDSVKLQAAAKEFEGMYMDIVMKSMRETANEPDVFSGSGETKLFQSMLDTEYAKMSSARGDIGLAKAIVKQLSPHVPSVKDPT